MKRIKWRRLALLLGVFCLLGSSQRASAEGEVDASYAYVWENPEVLIGQTLTSSTFNDTVTVLNVKYEPIDPPEIVLSTKMGQYNTITTGKLTLYVDKEMQTSSSATYTFDNLSGVILHAPAAEGYESALLKSTFETSSIRSSDTTFVVGKWGPKKGLANAKLAYETNYELSIIVGAGGEGHMLTGTASTYEYATGVTLSMGDVSFKSESGEEITVAQAGDTVKAVAAPSTKIQAYDFEFVNWEADGMTLSEEDSKKPELSFQMPDNAVTLRAVFQKTGTTVTISVRDYSLGNIKANYEEEWSDGTRHFTAHEWTDGKEATDIYKNGGRMSFTVRFGEDPNYGYRPRWVIKVDGRTLSDDEITLVDDYWIINGKKYTYTAPVMTLTGGTVEVEAVFEARPYEQVKVTSSDPVMGTAAVGSAGASSSYEFLDDTVTVTAAPASDMYGFRSWEILSPEQNENTAETEKIELTDVSESGSDVKKAQFTMIGSPVEIQAVFEKVKLSSEKLLTEAALLDKTNASKTIGQVSSQGRNYTVTLPDTLTEEEATAVVSGGSSLRLVISEFAQAAQDGGVYSDAEAWEKGIETRMPLNTPVVFTVKAEDGTTQEYTVTIAWEEKKSSEKEITEISLLDMNTKDVIASGTLDETAWTIQLPPTLTAEEAAKIASGGSYLKIAASDKASVAQAGGYDDKGQESWGSGNILCYMDLNNAVKFTVTAEDGSTQDYTITIAYTEPDPDKPVLTVGTVNRTSDSEAKFTFTSDTAGKYYYKLAESGSAVPDMDLTGAGLTAKKGTNTVSLTTLSAGAKDLYVVVVSNDGAVSDPLKIEIPAYNASEKTYKISLSYPTAGGTLTVSSTSAKAGDIITVTVTPKSGKRLVAGSLKYSESSAGGAVVNIDETTLKFTMPASEISISCTWEDDTSDTPQTTDHPITAFMVSGVSGVINDTTGRITITLPNGTDLTSLSPVIVTADGVKSVSPKSGAAVDLSKAVTYTVTYEDGTTKQYTVNAYTEAPAASDQLWEDMLNGAGGSTDHTGSNTWWEKAKKFKRHNDYPEYWAPVK